MGRPDCDSLLEKRLGRGKVKDISKVDYREHIVTYLTTDTGMRAMLA